MTDENEKTLVETLQGETDFITGQAARIAEIGDRRIADLRAQLEEVKAPLQQRTALLEELSVHAKEMAEACRHDKDKGGADMCDYFEQWSLARLREIATDAPAAQPAPSAPTFNCPPLAQKMTAPFVPSPAAPESDDVVIDPKVTGLPHHCPKCSAGVPRKQVSQVCASCGHSLVYPYSTKAPAAPEGATPKCSTCGSADVDDRGNCNACLERRATDPRHERSAEATAAHNLGEKGVRELAGPYLDGWWRSEPEKERFSGLRNFAAEIINTIERLQSDVAGKLTVTEEVRTAARTWAGNRTDEECGAVLDALARVVGEGK